MVWVTPPAKPLRPAEVVAVSLPPGQTLLQSCLGGIQSFLARSMNLVTGDLTGYFDSV